jgi:nucleoside-diphosphate-sugar epimerase
MAKYLITGIAGFIGSSLAHELLELGHEVCGVDNLSTGDIANIGSLLSDIEFHELDINDTDQMRNHCRGVDCVLHQAALASVPRSIEDPLTSHISNVNGTLSVLLAARDAGVSRVVYAASSSAYGDKPMESMREDMAPAPISPYAVQKLAGEHYVQSFWRAYGLEGVCLRYFNVFGPRQSATSSYSGVIARFVTDMVQGVTPTIFGEGCQNRDFTYIDNVVSANVLASTAPADMVAGEVFNIGTGCSQTLNGLYSALADLLMFPEAAHHGSPRPCDVASSRADIAKAHSRLEYTPHTRFARGLRSTVEWYLEKEAENKLNPVRALPRHRAQEMLAS